MLTLPIWTRQSFPFELGTRECRARVAERVGFEPTKRQGRLPALQAGALNHSATSERPLLLEKTFGDSI